MNHRRFTYTLLVDITAAAIVACFLIGVSLVAPDFIVGVLVVGLIPALVVAIFIDTIRRRPLTDTDRYCANVDDELDAAESRRRDRNNFDAGVAQPVERHVPSVEAAGSMPAARFPLTSHLRGVSRGADPRGSGSRQPSERLAGSNPFVVTAYVDLAWATHDLALHSYRVTRPGR